MGEHDGYEPSQREYELADQQQREDEARLAEHDSANEPLAEVISIFRMACPLCGVMNAPWHARSYACRGCGALYERPEA